jgi:hypothetical protein
MGLTPDDAGQLLRTCGLRSTPQRRAILSVFGGGRTEHLSADEIYARAAVSLSDLSRTSKASVTSAPTTTPACAPELEKILEYGPESDASVRLARPSQSSRAHSGSCFSRRRRSD